MKKTLFLLILTVIIFGGCEKDDFCIEEITPNLILRFYDFDNQNTVSQVSELTIWPEGRDTIVLNQTLDSVAIPLNVHTAQTIYNLSRGTTVDKLIIDYTVNEIYVSRSCGYKAEFSELSATTTNDWIQSINLSTTTIEDETSAHIQVFH